MCFFYLYLHFCLQATLGFGIQGKYREITQIKISELKKHGSKHRRTPVRTIFRNLSTLTFNVPSIFLARYLIPSLDRANAGHYRCIVRNRVGAIMQCSTEVQVACELMLCSPREKGKDGLRNQALISLSPLSPFLSISCPFLSRRISHHSLPAFCQCFYPLSLSNLSILSSSLFCRPSSGALHLPLPPASIFHPPLVFTRSPHLVFSLRQIWAVSWRPSDPRRCRRARALWCTRRGYTASPGRRSLGSETAAKFPPAAACE